VGSIKEHFDELAKGLEVYCLYVDADILEEISKRVMRGRKGDKHYRTSWFMEI
jgi:hypothetical protein